MDGARASLHFAAFFSGKEGASSALENGQPANCFALSGTMSGRATLPPFPIPRIVVRPDELPRHYRCPADWSCDLLLHDFDLWFVVRGRGALEIDGSAHVVTGPQIWAFQPGQRVLGSHEAQEPLEVYAFHFSTPRGHQRAARALATRLCRIVPRNPVRLQEHCSWLVAAVMEQDATAVPQVAAIGLALLMQLWRDLHRSPALPADWRIDTLIREICRRPQEPWDARQMAREAGISESHLAKRFRAITGFAPRQFVIRRRIRFAETLMSDTQLSLGQIAEAAGYRDVFFFSRQFKQLNGVPPASYRQQRTAVAGTY